MHFSHRGDSRFIICTKVRYFALASQLQAGQQGSKSLGQQQQQAGHLGGGQLAQQGRGGSGAVAPSNQYPGSNRNSTARLDMGNLNLGSSSAANHASQLGGGGSGGGGAPSRSYGMPGAPASSELPVGLELGMRSLDISGCAGGDSSSNAQQAQAPVLAAQQSAAVASEGAPSSQGHQSSPAPSPPLQVALLGVMCLSSKCFTSFTCTALVFCSD